MAAGNPIARPLNWFFTSLIPRLRGLSPLGPIFSMELRTTARRKRTYVLRFFYLAALFLGLLFCWAIFRMDSRQPGSVATRAQNLAQMGMAFFGVFSFFTLGAMGLVGPILTSTAINSERLHKTLPVLLMTPISAWQIVSGKLFSRVLIALTLIGLTLPVLAVVRLLGGVEIEQMVGVLCICVATVLMTAAVGLILSTLISRAYAVILLSYAFLGFLYMLLPLICALILNAISGPMGPMGRGWQRVFMPAMSVANPAVAVGLLAIPEPIPFRTLSWEWCVLAHLGFATLLLSLSAALLRRVARRESEGGAGPASTPVPELIVNDPVPEQTGAAAPPPLPKKRRAKPAGDVADNPVLWRELRRPLIPRRWLRLFASVVVAGLLVVIYLLLWANDALKEVDAQIPFAFVFCIMLNVLVCILSATAIAQEKESDTWTLLLATPLDAWRIIWGKLMGLLRRLIWPAVLIGAHFIGFTGTSVINVPTLLLVLWIIFTSNAIWLAVGLYLSLRLRTVTFAVILNLLGPVIIYAGVALVLGTIGALRPGGSGRDNWAESVAYYMPYFYLAEGINDLNSRHSWSDGTVYMPFREPVTAPTFLGIAFLVGCGYLAVTAAIIWYTAVRFDAIVGRAPQREPEPPLLMGRAEMPLLPQ